MQFSAEKYGVFVENQCYYKIFTKLAAVWAKNANFFAEFFGKKIF
jgi:hypothetical protein